MPAVFTDAVQDGTLDNIAAATIMFILVNQETTYSAMNSNKLASQVLSGADFTKADDTSGRKVTRSAKTGISVTGNGTAGYIGYGISASSTIIGTVPLAAPVAVTSGGTVDIGAHKMNIQDPT